MGKHEGFNAAVHLLWLWRTETRLVNTMIQPEEAEEAGPFTHKLVNMWGTLMKKACDMEKEQ